eukprot:2266918-Alexandrium_andersonii.AAC.1
MTGHATHIHRPMPKTTAAHLPRYATPGPTGATGRAPTCWIEHKRAHGAPWHEENRCGPKACFSRAHAL